MENKEVEMKKCGPSSKRAVALAVLLAMTSLSAGSSGQASGSRTYSGSVLVPTYATQAAIDVARCAWITDSARSQGVLAFGFALTAADAYHRISIDTADSLVPEQDTVMGSVSGPRFAVFLFDRRGTCDESVTPIHSGTSEWDDFVPYGARFGLVMRMVARGNVGNCYALLPWCVATDDISAPGTVGPEPFTLRISES